MSETQEPIESVDISTEIPEPEKKTIVINIMGLSSESELNAE